MKTTHKIPYFQISLVLLAAATALFLPMEALANTAPVTNYSYQETQQMRAGGNELIFGVAAYKLCSIKNFLFMAVYILAAIAFVIFAIKALFTKFDFKSFLPIIGAIFVVAFADLFIYFMADQQAWFCPTVMSGFSSV